MSDKNIYVVTNEVDISRFSQRDTDVELLRELHLQGKFVAGYIGTHGLAHTLDSVLEAAKSLKLDTDADRFRIIFLGGGANKEVLQKRAETEGLDNFVFVDSVSKDEVVRNRSNLGSAIIRQKNIN